MKSLARSSMRSLVATMLCTVVASGLAQTPAQLEYERQQREYWRQQEQQRQEQQRQQQLMQDNARRQQEESSRINAPAGQAPGGAAPGAAPAYGGDPSGAQAASAARAMWEKRPALPPDRNPLLGKWSRPASTRANPSDPFGQIMAMAKGGLCEVLFGSGGVFEFRPDRLVGMDERTREQELDRVEYRGDAKHVVVLPKTTLKLMDNSLVWNFVSQIPQEKYRQVELHTDIDVCLDQVRSAHQGAHMRVEMRQRHSEIQRALNLRLQLDFNVCRFGIGGHLGHAVP